MEPSTSTTNTQQIGRYRLCGEIASGGMATVYLAKIDGPGGFEKFFAIKRVHSHLVKHTSIVNMFLDEARLAARINHPNVCQVVDFGVTDDGNYFLAMDYIVGETLARVLRRVHRLGARRFDEKPSWSLCSAYIIAGIAEGLHAAHELIGDDDKPLNVVHRDVTPSNIFVTHRGAVRIVDFGIAQAENRLESTTAGQVKGKLGYMAPEQATGERIDRRADVWSLGVCLWEMLATKRLFYRQGNDAATLAAVLKDDILPPSTHNSRIDPALDEIVLRALQRNPNKRYQTAQEFAQDLRRYLTKQDEMVGTTEIGAFMERIFTDEIAEKQAFLKEARQLDKGIPLEKLGPTNVLALADLRPSTMTTSARPQATPIGGPERRKTLALALGMSFAFIAVIFVLFGQRVNQADTSSTNVRTESTLGTGTPTLDMPSKAGTEAPTAATASADAGPPNALDSQDNVATDIEATADAAVQEEPDEPEHARRKRARSSSRHRRARAAARTRNPDPPTAVAQPKQEQPDEQAGDSNQEPESGKVEPKQPKPVVIEAPIPKVTSAPSPAPPKPAVVKVAPAPPKLDARVSTSNLDVRGPISKSIITPGLDAVRGAYRPCYKAAAKRAGRDQDVTLSVSFEIGSSRRAHKISVRSGQQLPGLSTCVQNALQDLRVRRAPDVGVARVSYTIRFRPLP